MTTEIVIEGGSKALLAYEAMGRAMANLRRGDYESVQADLEMALALIRGARKADS